MGAREQLAKLAQWAGSQSQLRWLLLAAQNYRPGAAEQAQLEEAQGRNPALAVQAVQFDIEMEQRALVLAPELEDLLRVEAAAVYF
jgi:signal recognition particle GTPase